MATPRDTRSAPVLPADLTAAIERAGYYPALVADVVESALARTPSSRTSSTRRRRSTRTPSVATSPSSR